jgi:hypothetical protein
MWLRKWQSKLVACCTLDDWFEPNELATTDFNLIFQLPNREFEACLQVS